MEKEKVLVVPRDIIFGKGEWQGIKKDNLDYYIDLIKNNCQFRNREEVENDPSWQQIIPYILFNFGDKYFLYRYLEKAGEQRLRNDYILGIGGHINPVDLRPEEDILEVGMMREWNEEVDYRGNLVEKKLIGILNDDRRPVESVHLGLVYQFQGDSSDIEVKENDKIKGEMVDLKEMGGYVENTEGWAPIIYKEYLSKLMEEKKYPGKFFVFEGIDGSGKSTQTNLLADKLKKEGYEVEKIDFPQHGERSSALVDDYLNGKYGNAKEVGPYVASIFYACDRYDASFKIRKWLEEGKIVVADRYMVSNMGHQGGKIADKEERKGYFSWLHNLEYDLFKIPKPDYTFILKTAPKLSLELSNKITDEIKIEKRKSYLGDDKKQDIHEKDESHLADTLGSFLHVAEEYPEEFKVIECLNDEKLLAPEIIHQKIWELIKNRLVDKDNISNKRRIYTLPNDLMPEVKAVTFAKCSRSPEPFDQIAQELTEEKSSEFHEKWVVGFGHSSVAEHAIISLAVENVSILATKVIEDSRLASYTEKSTRYQVFNRDRVYKPENIMNSDLRDTYENMINLLMDTYQEITQPMMDFIKIKYPKKEGESDKLYEMVSKSKACDNIRYLLPIATLTNLGITINARELEHLIKKLLSHSLAEMQDIGREIKEEAVEAVPTLVRFADKNPYLSETKQKLTEIADQELGQQSQASRPVTIVNYDSDAENKLITAILYPRSRLSYGEIYTKVREMSQDKKEEIIDESLKRRDKFDAPLRELEHVYYTFDILMDYGAFRDVQRHRMCTQANQEATVVHGYDMPPDIAEAGLEDKFRKAADSAVEAYQKIYAQFPKEAQYVVPLCFRKRLLITWNLRELHHFISLRSGKKGHPSYRKIAQECWRQLNHIQPLLAKYIRVDMDEEGSSWAASLENKDFYYNPWTVRKNL